MPPFTLGTYWQDCFRHVALFLQLLINIESDDLERKKKRERENTCSQHYIDNTVYCNEYLYIVVDTNPPNKSQLNSVCVNK